jgi:two-component system, NtrC family, sensor histidine kinase HydH
LSIAAGGCAIAYRGLVAAGGVLLLSAGAFGVCLMVLAVESGRSLLERRARVTQLAALGRWSGYMAHDFKNPLAALKGAAQFLLEERAQGRSIDHQSKFLSLLVNETNRLARLLDRYQHFAALGAIKQPTSLNALLEQLAAQHRAGLPPEVSLELALDSTLPPCPLDAELALAALENLLRNAIEAMPHGGRVTLRTSWRVEIEALSSARKPREGERREVSVAVADTGRGMNPRELALACEDFFTTKEPGRGQGLPMVKRVAAAHGGSLHSQSRLGHGTCMTLVFPC